MRGSKISICCLGSQLQRLSRSNLQKLPSMAPNRFFSFFHLQNPAAYLSSIIYYELNNLRTLLAYSYLFTACKGYYRIGYFLYFFDEFRVEIKGLSLEGIEFYHADAAPLSFSLGCGCKEHPQLPTFIS